MTSIWMALSPNPLVSVVIPVLNGEQHVEACIRSVLNQTYENTEVIVSVNASRDRTTEIVRSFTDPRLRLLPEVTELLSLHANWARGLAGARGELIKIVCHDDLLLPECLSVQIELLQQYPEAVLTSSRRHIIDDNGRVLIRARGIGNLAGPSGTREVSASEIARACTRAGTNLLGEPASALVRRAALPDPLFDPRWHYTIDVEFYMRCLEHNDAVVDSRVLCSFRVSHKQWSAAIVESQAKELRSFFAEMVRRYPDSVTKADVRLGAMRAQLLTAGRRALYLKLRLGAKYFDFWRQVRRVKNSSSNTLEDS